AGVRPCVPELVNSLGMRLALIPPGAFRRGSPTRERGRYDDESLRRLIRITRPFWLGGFQLTQGQDGTLTGTNPSCFRAGGHGARRVKGLDTRTCPVENVSWEEADDFCHRLSKVPAEQAAGRVYRLPTEAEWEYACRGETTTVFNVGNTLTSTQANM